jgi:hypothetical protein
MAVKVMVASAIVNGGIESPPRRATGAQPAKPKRRRSSVYDADGNEVFITLLCLKCRRTRPLSQFGLRRMADGAIRNQPWCRTCRSAAGTERPAHGEAAEAAESPAAPPSAAETAVEGAPASSAASAGEPARRPGAIAAEIAAALAAGLRR